jgi:hypothetical protein
MVNIAALYQQLLNNRIQSHNTIITAPKNNQ